MEVGGIMSSVIEAQRVGRSSSELSIDAIQNIFNDLIKDVPWNHFNSGVLIRQLLDGYGADDLRRIYEDYQRISETIFEGIPLERSIVVLASNYKVGQSIFFKKYLALTQNYALISQNEICMKMRECYGEDINKNLRTMDEAANYWINAAEFISEVLFARGLNEGYSLAYASFLYERELDIALRMIQDEYKYSVSVFHMTFDNRLTQLYQKRIHQNKAIILPSYQNGCHSLSFFFENGNDCINAAEIKYNSDLKIYDLPAFKYIQEQLRTIRMDGSFLSSRFNFSS